MSSPCHLTVSCNQLYRRRVNESNVVRYWLKALGSAASPLSDDWEQVGNGVLRRHATFSKRPIVKKGDEVVYSASGTGLFFAAGSVTSHPYLDRTDSRDWPWRVDVELQLSTRFIHDGVRLDELVLPSSHNDVRNRIKRRSHVQLTADEHRVAVEKLGACRSVDENGIPYL